MDATPIDKSGARPLGAGPQDSAQAPGDRDRADPLARKWFALHDAAAAVAAIGGEPAEQTMAQVRDFPGAIAEHASWRRELAQQGIEDMTAFMEPGLSALLSAMAQGVDPQSAARALYREFRLARDTLLALAPAGSLEDAPRRD